MKNSTSDSAGGSPPPQGFRSFALKRIVLGIVATLAVIWLVSFVLDRLAGPEPMDHTAVPVAGDTGGVLHAPPLVPTPSGTPPAALEHGAPTAAGHAATTEAPGQAPAPAASQDPVPPAPGATGRTSAFQNEDQDSSAPAGPAPAPAAGAHAPAAHQAAPAVADVPGVAFVDAFIRVLDHEVNQRVWGWRPNDIIEYTDNVNNFQLGVLEVARRTSEALADRISRTGSTQAFDKDLEAVRNKVMINANQYWLPSAEDSYADAVDMLRRYREKLIQGTAPFYSRTDNLIPLLRAYVNLLGSCDDNLIKTHEDSGDPVSWFKADDYFYYAQGVAHAMHAILEAAAVDFATTLEGRRGADEVMHHAITSLEHATHVDPLIILDSSLNSFLANHRSNLAGPISHARFYLDLLIETLST
jgi:hypothetical protein